MLIPMVMILLSNGVLGVVCFVRFFVVFFIG
jgi:hypothetical protein